MSLTTNIKKHQKIFVGCSISKILFSKWIGSTGNAIGLEYGARISCRISHHFSISAEYTTVKMDIEGLMKYDYTNAGGYLKFIW